VAARNLFLSIWFLSFLAINPVYAVPLADLDESKEWRVEKIVVSGNQQISDSEVRDEMLTKARPWYQFWSARPLFDPVTFETDLERLRRFYEARGYYQAVIGHDLVLDEADSLVAIELRIEEGAPVVVTAVDVRVVGELPATQRPALPETLPLKRGERFQEAPYLMTEQALRQVFLRNGYAHTESKRRAEVNIDDRQAQVEYTLTPGPPAVFGATEIRGTETIDRSLIERELTYRPGEKFSSDKLAATRAKLLGLDLFSSVRIAPGPTTGHPPVVPIVVDVAERPYRDIKIGVGYNTEEEFRSQIEWRHLNWFGGGRRLAVQAKYSSIGESGEVNLVQPHFYSPTTQAVLNLKYATEKEQTFDRNFGRFAPRLDHQFSPSLSGFVGFRVEYDNLSDIDRSTVEGLGGVLEHGLLAGPSAGLVWSTRDSPFEPKKGTVLALKVEQAGVIWGGDYRFFKITGEAKKYYEIGWDTVFAARVKLGLGDSLGAKDRFPIFERFYAGGENSVRGYGRRRLGPLSRSDDPLGGLSLLEGSVELRRPIWRDLGGAVFVDFGQLALEPFDKDIFNLNFSAGFGLSYKTPVGPVRLDVGFPFQKPPKDRPWQIYFSIGAFF